MILNPNPSKGWQPFFNQECTQDYYLRLNQSLEAISQAGIQIFPQPNRIFRAFQLSSLEGTRVVILGQDPYSTPGLADGLSFSVPRGMPLPPSLRNIYTELSRDLRQAPPPSGDLQSWASQGVLLLNATLTVSEGRPNSHKDLGWVRFTDRLIHWLSEQRPGLVFILWGREAASKARLIDPSRHHLIISAHPSPLAAHRGFWGSRPFSRANHWLIQNGEPPIDWINENQTHERD